MRLIHIGRVLHITSDVLVANAAIGINNKCQQPVFELLRALSRRAEPFLSDMARFCVLLYLIIV